MSFLRTWGFIPLSLSLLAVMLILTAHPGPALEAGIRGLSIWWDVLFPSLFPFFVLSELMLGLGIVHFAGSLLDPVMRPLFRIPGSGGFVAAISCASGYPVGAKLTAQLWEQGKVSREEGERLVAFTTSSDPIFLMGAVCVGFFHDPSLALILMLGHYGGALCIALLMRYHGASHTVSHPSQPASTAAHKTSLLKQALLAMQQARIEDGRSVGTLLRQAIISSLKLIMVVGGLVVFFSVFLQSLMLSGLMTQLNSFVATMLRTAGFPVLLTDAITGGIFEVTLGARAAGQTEGTPLVFKAATAAFVLSWGGLSVHAQIASILNHTNIRYWPFLIARCAHAIIASLLILLLWNVVQPLQALTPVWLSLKDSTQVLPTLLYKLSMLHTTDWYITISAFSILQFLLFLSLLMVILLLALVVAFIRSFLRQRPSL